MIRIGVIGTGAISNEFLVPAIRKVDNGIFWSVLSRDQNRADFFSVHHKAQAQNASFSDINNFLQDPKLDAVIIATPDGLHASQAIAAARAGKHVFVEKPMANSISDAEAVIAECDRYNVRLAVGYHSRWHQGHRKLRDEIWRNELGSIHHLRAHWSFKANERSDWHTDPALGRWWSLAGVGTHLIDWAYWLLMPTCGVITSTDAIINRARYSRDLDVSATVTLQFESGATAQLYSSILASGPTRSEILGTDGHAHCENTLGQCGNGTIQMSKGNLLFEPLNPYQCQIANFVDAIICKNNPEVSGEDGLRNVKLLESLTSN